MLAAANPTLNPNSPLHLYRHILREISYLPPAARGWATARAAERFRSRPGRAELQVRRRIYVAYGALQRLRAANSGHTQRMRDILFQAFGRRGRRRRQLVSKLTYGQGPENMVAPPSLMEESSSSSNGQNTGDVSNRADGSGMDGPNSTTPGQPSGSSRQSLAAYIGSLEPRSVSQRRWDWLDRWDLPTLQRYLVSQKAQQRKTTTQWPGRLPIKTTDPATFVPECNAWHRAWDPKTYRTKLAKAWKRSVDKIQPPLPRSEWELLKKIVLNEEGAEHWRVPKKRTSVPVMADGVGGADGAEMASAEASWNWTRYATLPVRHIERAQAPRNIRLSRQEDPGPYGRKLTGAPLRNDNRWIRRLFKSVWQASSVVDQDPKTLKTKITWGHKPYSAVPVSSLQHELFSGVDAKGKSPRVLRPARELPPEGEAAARDQPQRAQKKAREGMSDTSREKAR